jgi:phosphate:Na+ symporter
MLEYIALVIAGLGLFFAGLQILTEHLKQLTGRRFRLWVAKWTQNRLLGALWGAAFFAITQSGGATTFIIVSMVTSGLIGIVQALPMIAGLNMGGGLMVLVVTSDIKGLLFLILGIAGIGYANERMARWRPLIRALFGGGLLFLGLNMVQEGAAPLASEPWLQSWLAGSAGSPLVGFLIGTFLVVLTQSSIAISVLAITFTSAGLFTMEQTVMTIYGANLGSGIGTYLLSANLSGGPRQISMAQVLYNVLGVLIFVPLFYVETLLEVPLVIALITNASSDIAVQASLCFMLFNFVPGLITILPLQFEARQLERIWPPTEQESESSTVYLHKQALKEPVSAIGLARMEQNRLFALLPKVLDIARTQPPDSLAQLKTRGEVHDALSLEITHYLHEIAATNPGAESFERLSEVMALQDSLDHIHEGIVKLSTHTLEVKEGSSILGFSRNMIEGVDAIVLTLADCLESGADEPELTLIDSMVDGRRGVLQQIRDVYLNASLVLNGEEKRLLLEMINQCGRLFWLFGQLRSELTKDHFAY